MELGLWVLAAVLMVPAAQSPEPTAPMMGRELYEQACARCHGSDGRGDRPDIQLNAPMPNFARCSEASEEPDEQWRITIEKGGIVFGLSDQMPAYGEVLTAAQIDSLLAYMRGFCPDRRWVRGEMNFRRSLFTEKAYPENELVFAPRLGRTRGRHVEVDWANLLERRIGPRTQIEVALPLRSVDSDRNGRSQRASGVGDVDVGIKHVLAESLRHRALVSAGVELAFPVGRSGAGLGSGTLKVEPFAAAGKEIGAWTFQGAFRLELPADTARAEREIAWSAVAGRNVWAGQVRELFGALELVASRELVAGERSRMSLVPQLRFPIDRLGRWAVAAGPVVPVRARGEARVGFAAYLLFEYMER